MNLAYKIKNGSIPYLFLLPSLIFFFTFKYIPIGNAITFSFQKFTLNGSIWVGLNNFAVVFSSNAFWRAVAVTIEYAALSVLLGLAVSLLVSFMIEPLPSLTQTFFKSAFYLPGILSGVIIAIIWEWIYEPNFGLINAILGKLGIPGGLWLSDPKTALFCIVIIGLLTGQGANILILLASICAMPTELFEAAKIDGAGKWKEIMAIKIPLLMPTILFVIVTNTIGAFQEFANIYLLTRGGPSGSTTTIGFSIFNYAFNQMNFGVASAQAVVLLAIVGIIAFLQFKFLSNKVDY